MKEESFTSTSTGMTALVWSPIPRQENKRTLLYLHGAGGFDRGMAGLFEYPDFPSLLRDGMEVDCRVVIPSCHIGEEWRPSLVASFLCDFESEYERPSRGYDLVGYSRGGRGVYEFAAAEPNRVRTAAAVSARDMPELVPALCRLPIFICHGVADLNTPVERVRRMYRSLKAAGCNCELSIVAGDHFIIADVLRNGLIFRWQENAI